MGKCPITGHECNYKKDIHVTDIDKSNNVSCKDMCIICGLPFLAKESGQTPQTSPLLELISFFFNDFTAKHNTHSGHGCKTCGQTIEQFLNTGRIGCANCYEFHKKEFVPMIEKCQMLSQTHVGKVPNNNKQVRLNRLQEELKEAIKKEDYETAQGLKQKIEELNK